MRDTTALLLLLLLLLVPLLPAHAGGAIVVDETSSGCVLTGKWADNQGNNPDRQRTSTAGLVGGTQHYTSRHPPYARTGRETATFTPNLPKAGNYKVEVSYRCSENRSSKVTYEVRHAKGVFRKTINQRTGGGKTGLGVFAFEAGTAGSVAMVDDHGASASVDAAFFTPTDAPEGPAAGDPGSDLDRIVGGDGGAPDGGTTSSGVKLTAAGKKTFVAPADGTVRVTARLSTYGPASLKVLVGDREWMRWSRAGDKDGSPLEVDGKPDAASIVERAPGDMSPTPRTNERKVRKGDRVALILEGDFGAGTPELSLAFSK